MFTGIIEHRGRVIAIAPVDGREIRLSISPEPQFDSISIGESIAVNGVCLTLEPDSKPETLSFFVSQETFRLTTLGLLKADDIVNLERAMRADSRLGGHWVSGHVDERGMIRSWEKIGDGYNLQIEYPAKLAQFLALKGSVCVDGISLTISNLEKNSFGVAVIPHTVAQTTLRNAEPGQQVNLEVDMLARYVVRALELRG